METNKEAFYVVTGGPGVGKTTLIHELSRQGFQTVEEDARKIIKEQIETKGQALPWKDKERYAKLMLDASLRSYKEVQVNTISNSIFFDRGILDTVCYMKMEQIPISNEVIAVARQHSYNRSVFVLPSWQEIYATDSERKQSWEEAVFTFKKMKETYLEFGYDVIEVPKLSVKGRVKFIIQHINESKKRLGGSG